MVIFENIPDQLKVFDNWVLWRLEQRDGRHNLKMPYSVSGHPASVADPSTWASFERVREAYERGGYSGVGFVFDGHGVFGLDLDGCLNGDQVAWWAKEIIERFPTYCEVSPSKTGIKAFFRGSLSQGRRFEVFGPPICDKNPAIEVYGKGRYFTVTGWQYGHHTTLESYPENAIIERLSTFGGRPVVERARRYIAKIPGAISGQGGHNKTYYVAAILVDGFALPREVALNLLREYNERCQPPWSERELVHKIDSAFAHTQRRGFLLGKTDQELAESPLPSPSEFQVRKVEKVSLYSFLSENINKIVERNNLHSLGLPELDEAIGGGVEAGEMVVVAGRPGHGKSAFAIQAACELCRQGLPGLYISEEMGRTQIGRRITHLATEIPERFWAERALDIQNDIYYFWEEREALYIAESCCELATAVATIENAIKEDGIRFVVVDYLQLLRSGRKAGRYEEVSEISLALRQLASRHSLILIAICQLNRAIEGRQGRAVAMSDLRDSGQIEQDADVILFTVHPYKLKWSERDSEFHIYVLKNRNRPIVRSMVTCTFDGSRQRFLPYSGEEGLYDEVPF